MCTLQLGGVERYLWSPGQSAEASLDSIMDRREETGTGQAVCDTLLGLELG